MSKVHLPQSQQKLDTASALLDHNPVDYKVPWVLLIVAIRDYDFPPHQVELQHYEVHTSKLREVEAFTRESRHRPRCVQHSTFPNQLTFSSLRLFSQARAYARGNARSQHDLAAVLCDPSMANSTRFTMHSIRASSFPLFPPPLPLLPSSTPSERHNYTCWSADQWLLCNALRALTALCAGHVYLASEATYATSFCTK